MRKKKNRKTINVWYKWIKMLPSFFDRGGGGANVIFSGMRRLIQALGGLIVSPVTSILRNIRNKR